MKQGQPFDAVYAAPAEHAPFSLADMETEGVPREPLCARLCDSSARLVLVCAPPGFGKTTLMTQARARLAAQGIAAGWLTVELADNDTARFIGALHRAVAGMLIDGALPGAPAELMRRLARHVLPFALFLDDFDRLQDAGALGIVREIIAHLPPQGRVVIGARVPPDLGLARLRAHGQLHELTVEDLRFSVQDTERFFALRPQLGLRADDVTRLHERTEGWVAALMLAALALENRSAGEDFIATFSGSDDAVARYLMEAVLAAQPAATREFMLRTSILRELDPDLCEAVVPGCDGRRMLENLQAQGLLVTTSVASKDGGGRAVRYLGLFAGFLHAELMRTRAGLITRLHLAASAWYEAHRQPAPAIDHALEGGDFPHATELLLLHAERFIERGRLRLLARWLSALPTEFIVRHPLLQVASVWSICFTRGPAEAWAQLSASEAEASDDPVVRAHVGALKPLLLVLLDRFEEALLAGRAGLADLPSCRPFTDIVLSNAMARVLSVLGEPAESRRMLDEARRASHGDLYTRQYTEATEAILDLHEGRLRQAAARLGLAAGGADNTGFNPMHANAWAGALYASTVYEFGELDQALHLLDVYQPLVRGVVLPDRFIIEYTLRARIAFHRGDATAAMRLLDDMAFEGHRRRLPRVIAAAQLERAWLLLMQGRAAEAREALDQADVPGLWDRVRQQRLPSHDVEDLAIGRLRWDIACGDAASALPKLEAEVAAAMRASRLRRVLKLRVLQALAHHRLADVASALETLETALRQAGRDGFVRLVLDEGPAIAPLLQRLRERHQERSGLDAGFAAYLDVLADHLAHGRGAASASEGAFGVLTPQEVRVLEQLAEGRSNGEIAARLGISDSTVRTHLRSINVKLDTHSRTQAVAAARRLAVIRS